MKPGEQPLQTAQGFAVEPSRDWVARQAVLAQMQAEKPVAPSVAQHHTFLKKIGKAVAVAGELAATAINSAANPYAMNGGANPTFGSNFGGMTGMH